MAMIELTEPVTTITPVKLEQTAYAADYDFASSDNVMATVMGWVRCCRSATGFLREDDSIPPLLA